MNANRFLRDKTLPLSDLEKILPQAHQEEHKGRPIPAFEIAKIAASSIGPAARLAVKSSTLKQWPRLLHQGIDPILLLLIQASNTAIISRWLNRGSKVVFLSSFPRSGNTWMRFMLSDVVLQTHGVETSTQLPVHPDNLIAEFSTNCIARRLARCPAWAFETSLAFVKTHSCFERVEQIISSGETKDHSTARDARVVYVYRAPEDALVSLYHLRIRDSFSHSRAIHNLDDFCLVELDGWLKNITSYLRAADSGFPVFFMNYEAMLEDPAATLGEMLRWLELPDETQMAQRAVNNMQFAKLQAMEIQANKSRAPGHEKKLFFRRGGPGSGQAELSQSTLDEIRRQTKACLDEANSRRFRPTHGLGKPNLSEPLQNVSGHLGGAAMAAKVSASPR